MATLFGQHFPYGEEHFFLGSFFIYFQVCVLLRSCAGMWVSGPHCGHNRPTSATHCLFVRSKKKHGRYDMQYDIMPPDAINLLGRKACEFMVVRVIFCLLRHALTCYHTITLRYCRSIVELQHSISYHVIARRYCQFIVLLYSVS